MKHKNECPAANTHTSDTRICNLPAAGKSETIVIVDIISLLAVYPPLEGRQAHNTNNGIANPIRQRKKELIYTPYESTRAVTTGSINASISGIRY